VKISSVQEEKENGKNDVNMSHLQVRHLKKSIVSNSTKIY
jgi:hypothetical protein